MNFQAYSASYHIYLDSSSAANPNARYSVGSTIIGYINQNTAAKGWNYLNTVSTSRSYARSGYNAYMSVNPNGYGQTVADAILVYQNY